MSKRYMVMIIAFCALLIVPATSSARSDYDTLRILRPVERGTFFTSNVPVEVQFGFFMEGNPKVFRAWLNGKEVGGLFEFTETYVAQATLSVKDGLNASEKGPRMNVFAAEVEGLDGKKHRVKVQFLVDCSGNEAPVAEAARDERVFTHEFVQLDGSGSSDADGDPLAYHWSFVEHPKKSKVEFSDSSAVNPTFIPDVPGTYVVQLIVDDYKAKSEPKTVTIQADQLKILIDRPVDDTIFEIIKQHGVVTQFDGSSESIRDHLLAAFDGKGFTAEELRNDQLLKKALAAGKWGLVFNVAADQKNMGLTPELGLVNKGKAKAFLFRRFLDGNTPVVRAFELPAIPDSEIETDPEILLRYGGILLKALRERREDSLPSVTSAQSLQSIPSVQFVQSPPPDNPIPDGLINARWDYSYPFPWSKTYSARQAESKGRVQHGSYIVNYTFTLFLDNGNNPTGNRQFLLLQIDSEANPNDYGSSFVASQSDMDKNNEYAWFQDKFTVDVNPTPLASPLHWSWVNNDPTSPNATKTYTANASFTMGFNQAQGALGSFTYSSGSSYTLSDWGIKCNSSGNYMYWETLSTDPQQHDSGYAAPNNAGWYQFCGKPKQPNAMAMNQAQYHASVVWRTDSSTSSTAVASQIAEFTSHLGIHVADNWCKTDWGLCCSRCCDSAVDNFSSDLTWSLDLGAVIPISLSILFEGEKPVQVGPLGKTMKGLIVLASPAKVDTLISGISSNSPHASPKTDRVVVHKGEETAVFDINVNADGMAPGEYFTAEISAFYGQIYRESLRMQAAPQ